MQRSSEFAETHLASCDIGPSAQLSQRRFFYVDSLDVKWEHDKEKYSTVRGTHGLHSIASKGNDGKINVRELSCYCQECIQESYSQCENKSQVEPFRAISFSNEAGEIESFEIDSSVGDSQIIDTTPLEYTNSIGVDSFVAIKPSSDAIYSFFALHVTSSGVQMYMNWKKAPDHSMLTQIWLAQKCLKDIFLITKRLQEKGIYTRKTLKQRLSFHRSVLYIMALTFSLVQKSQTFMYFKMWIMKTFL